jgi:hypothetical protein
MSTSLLERLHQTRRRLRRVLVLHGVSWLVAAVIGAVTLAALVDWALHVSGGLRLLFLAAVAAVAAWVVQQYLVRPLCAAVRDLDLALRLERVHPQFAERLSATVDFLRLSERDPLSGSKSLRDRVVRETVELSRRVAFESIVRTQAARTVGIWSGVVMGLALCLVVASPGDAAVALRRLVNPFGGPEWPQRTHLHVVSAPERLAVGDPFTVAVEVSGVVPSRVMIEYRFEGGVASAGEPLKRIDTARFKGGLDAVARSFEYAIVAGRARTEWAHIAVVPAPEVESLQLSLAYPSYTGRSAERLPEGRGHVRAVVGTTVYAQGRSNKPLRQAEFVFDKQGSVAASSTSDREFAAQFVVRHDDQYRVILADQEGMTNTTRSPRAHRVEAVADAAPEVALEQPSGDIEVTANATVPIKALVKDDFGIASIELRYQFGAAEAAQADPKNEAKAAIFQAQQPTTAPGKDGAIVEPVFRKLGELAWSLEPLALTHGQVVPIYVAASDFRDSPGPNLGKSRVVRLRVVTKDEFLAQFENQQQRVREELERTLRLQQTAHSQVSDLEKQAEIVGRLSSQDVDRLQSAELIQRRVQEKVTASEQSILRQVDDLLGRLRHNRVEDVETGKRLTLLRSELARVAEQHLPPIAQALTQARKTSKGERDPGTASPPKQPGAADTSNRPTAELLKTATTHQSEVVSALVQMLEQLDKWDTIAQVTNEARELERRQGEVAAQTEKLAAQTLGKTDAELSPEQRSGLAKAAARQDENRNQLSRTQRKMTRLEERIARDEPLTAQLLKEAQNSLQQNNVSGQMADAAGDIRQNRMGEVARKHGQIERALRDLVDLLEDRREQELARLVKQLKEAEKELAGLREEQGLLRRQTEQANAAPDAKKRAEELARLQRRQRELQQKTEEFARRLSRMRAEQASRRSGRAAGRMGDAAQSLQRNQADVARQQQGEADDQLEQAQQELAQARQQAQDELAREQLAKIGDAIRQIHQRQLGVNEETVRLEKGRLEKGKWSRGELQSVSSLARVQRGLAEESKGLGEKLEGAKVFVMVIEYALTKMNEAHGLLNERQTGSKTQAAQAEAARQFARLIAALEPDPQQPGNQQPQGGAGQNQGGGSGDGIPTAAQIKLLKALQTDIHDRTVALIEAKRKTGQWDADELKTFDELSRRQGQLADLIREMTEPARQEEGER